MFKDNTVSHGKKLSRNFLGLIIRIRIGLGKILDPDPNCLIRVRNITSYTFTHSVARPPLFWGRLRMVKVPEPTPAPTYLVGSGSRQKEAAPYTKNFHFKLSKS